MNCRHCESELNEFTESKGRNGICRGCYASYMRQHYKNPIAKQKQIARVLANNKVIEGIIIKEKCSLCGSDKAENHHSDYSKPYDVAFICKPCHVDFHKLENKVYARN